MSSLPVQLVLFINARHYRTFNLQQYLSFTITHLKTSLAEDFGVPFRQIHFTRYSGLFIRDQDGLFNLRASDGNHASLDVTLPEHYSSSELAGKVISFKFRDNPHPTDLRGVSSDGIQKGDFEHGAQIEYHGAPSPPASPESPKLTLRLTKEQKIALRAQLEDPFNISSPCFEEEFEDEDSTDDESDVDADDDLYSDDGGFAPEELETPHCEVDQRVTPSEGTEALKEKKEACPADPAELQYERLISLASATSFYHPKREIPMRYFLLKSSFQRKLHKEIQEARSKVTSPLSSQRIINLSAAPPALTTPPTLNSQKVCLSSPTKPRPSLTQLVIPESSSALSVGVINHKETMNSPVVSAVGGDCSKRASSALRLTNLLLSLQNTRAFAKTEQRHKQVYVIQREVGLYSYGSL